MNKFYVGDHYDKPIVLALGFFDCIHHGHACLIDEAKHLAEKLNAETAITTYINDPNGFLGKKPQIYSLEERLCIFEQFKIDNVLLATFDQEMADTEPDDALNIVIQHFNVVGFVVGKDYTYGKGATGNVKTLKEFAEEHNIKVKVVPFEKFSSEKIASTIIKKHIIEGNIELINSYLTKPYFMFGTIVHAKQRGRMLGFPTANLSVHEDILPLGEGTYITKIYVDGKSHISVTNVGAKLTFDEKNYTIETYIPEFSKDIYDKKVKLEFYKRLRDVTKFNSIPALTTQVKKDVEAAKAYFRE